MLKGFIWGATLATALTLLISVHVGLGFIKAAHMQDVRAQILLANMAYESNNLKSLIEKQTEFASCSISYFEKLSDQIYKLHKDDNELAELRSSLKAPVKSCQ